jgi:hypothetical protein
MKLILTTTTLVALFSVASAVAPVTLHVQVRHDKTYDNPKASLSSTCPNDLAKKFPTFGSLPSYAGAAPAAVSVPTCGSCWQISLGGNSVYVTAVDKAQDGFFNLPLEAMNELTNGKAGVDAQATPVDTLYCGLK